MDYFNNFNEFIENSNKQQLINVENQLNALKIQIEQDFYKNKEFKLHSARKRVIKTIFGKINLKISVFYKKIGSIKKFFCPMRDFLKKYYQFDQNVVNQVFKHLKEGLTLTNISKLMKIQKSTLHYIIKSRNFNFLKVEQKFLVNNQKPIHINVDDTYLNLKVNKKKQKLRIRLLIFHQGKNSKTSKLENLCFGYYFPKFSKMKLEDAIQKIKNYFFDGSSSSFVMHSDGAREFLNQSNRQEFLHVLDKWHCLNKLSALMPFKIKNFYGFENGTRKQIRKKVSKLLKKGFVKKSISVLRSIQFKTFSKDLKTRIGSFCKYLKNNQQGIKNWNLDNGCSTTTEGFIFHKIKSMLGNKNKIFSFEIFNKMLSFKAINLDLI